MEPTPEQIAAERDRLLKILATERPHLKPGSRNRTWQHRREQAMDELRKLDRGEWRRGEDDVPW